jgi:hypothetical protein
MIDPPVAQEKPSLAYHCVSTRTVMTEFILKTQAVLRVQAIRVDTDCCQFQKQRPSSSINRAQKKSPLFIRNA